MRALIANMLQGISSACLRLKCLFVSDPATKQIQSQATTPTTTVGLPDKIEDIADQKDDGSNPGKCLKCDQEFLYYDGWHCGCEDHEEDLRLTLEQLEAARQALQAVVNTAAHPEVAIRSVMVDLKPVRAAIKRIDDFRAKNKI